MSTVRWNMPCTDAPTASMACTQQWRSGFASTSAAHKQHKQHKQQTRPPAHSTQNGHRYDSSGCSYRWQSSCSNVQFASHKDATQTSNPTNVRTRHDRYHHCQRFQPRSTRSSDNPATSRRMLLVASAIRSMDSGRSTASAVVVPRSKAGKTPHMLTKPRPCGWAKAPCRWR